MLYKFPCSVQGSEYDFDMKANNFPSRDGEPPPAPGSVQARKQILQTRGLRLGKTALTIYIKCISKS